MTITSRVPVSYTPARSEAPAPAPAPGPQGNSKGIDAFSKGATHGANIANTVVGVYNGGVAGVIVGGALGVGGSVLSTGLGALRGTTKITLDSVLKSAGHSAMAAGIGGIGGAVAGGLLTYGAGKFGGYVGANVARKFGGDQEIGRAAGTVGAGVLMGAVAGLSVAGWNGAGLAIGLGLAGGGLAFLKS